MGRTCAHPSEKTKQLCLLLEKGVCVGGGSCKWPFKEGLHLVGCVCFHTLGDAHRCDLVQTVGALHNKGPPPPHLLLGQRWLKAAAEKWWEGRGGGVGGGSGGQVYVEFKLNHQIQEELCSRPSKEV